jgi:photosystem II stability/assembly factor-like uncharacterized protein
LTPLGYGAIFDSLRTHILLIAFVGLLGVVAGAQPGPRILTSHTTENLRGVSIVSANVAWASGTHGTYLRMTDGQHWVASQVPAATSLDFRGVVAFSADEAFLMSAGPGDQSVIYHTADGGRNWELQFKNINPKGFFDCIVFWDAKHGIVLGDPIADESGKLKFELLATEDGQTWKPLPSATLPAAEDGEGAFAASNTCMAVLRVNGISPASQAANSALQGDGNIWFASGGKVSRVFHSTDRGRTWAVVDSPIVHGADSTGIFSIAFRDALHGVIAGGDYKHPDYDGPNLAFTEDGGKTWQVSDLHPQAYFSSVAYDQKVAAEANYEQTQQALDKNESLKKKLLKPKPVPPQRIFLIGQDFILDFQSPRNPRRISPRRKSKEKFNAVAPYPGGGALVVGGNGTIASVP